MWFGVCVCYLDVGFVFVVWIFVMVEGWNLHFGFRVFDAWFGVWGLGFRIRFGFERYEVWNVRYKIWCLRD